MTHACPEGRLIVPEFYAAKLQEFLSMSVMFTLVGAATAGLCRLLRLKPVHPKIENPKRSAVCALIAVSASMAIGTVWLVLRESRDLTAATGVDPQMRLLLYLMPQLVAILVYCFPMALMLRLNRETLRSAGLTSANLWKVTVIGFVLATFTLMNLGGAKNSYAHYHPVAALAYCSLVGFGEEFLFRGYLQTRLVAWLGHVKGWMLASVIMAVLHVPQRMLVKGMDFLPAFADSMMLVPICLFAGFVMLRTGSIVAGGIFHTFADWVHTR
jgi:membrane protease YdiL (CAAX protease family)